MNKNLNVFSYNNLVSITSNVLDGPTWPLQVMRANCDIPKTQGHGTKDRSLYICFNVVPTDHGYGAADDKLYKSDRLLFFDYRNPNADTGNNDLWGPSVFVDPNTIGGTTYQYMDMLSGGFRWGNGSAANNYRRGLSKIQRVVNAAWALKNNLGWNIGFGLTNEPNLLKGPTIL